MIRALTVWQPHAEWIAAGRKTVENRPWSTSYRGPLLIHAGRKVDAVESPLAESLPRGVFVALVELHGIHLARDDFGGRCSCSVSAGAEWHSGGWVRPVHHWLLRHARRVPNVPARGLQSLWSPQHAALAALSLSVTGEPTPDSVAVTTTHETLGGVQ
jgi:hypothetical protein